MNNTKRYLIEELIVPAGEHIQDWLDQHNMNVAELALRTDISRSILYKIIKGENPITSETASKLQSVTNISAEFWLNLESIYQLEKSQLAAQKRAEASELEIKAFIKDQPIAQLVKRGILPNDFKKLSTYEQQELLFRFYHVSNMTAYLDTNGDYKMAARMVKGTTSNSSALKAWIQLVINTARDAHATMKEEYNEQAFRSILPELVGLTAEIDKGLSPKDFLLKLQAKCREAGVIVEFIEKLDGVRNLCGVALWIGKNRPVIALTLHGQELEHIFFTFMHEAGHIVNDQHDMVFVSDNEAAKEVQADHFAADNTIPSAMNEEILETNGSLTRLSAVAERIGVMQDLVIGRYQYLTKNFEIPSTYKTTKISWNSIGDWKL